MDDLKEADSWENNEVQIEDLGAPEKGLGLFIFSLNQKLRSSSHLRTMPAALALMMCLLVALLLPGSSLLHPTALASPASSVSSWQEIGCSRIVIVVSTASVIKYAVPTDPTPSTSGTMYACGSIQILTPVPRKRQP